MHQSGALPLSLRFLEGQGGAFHGWRTKPGLRKCAEGRGTRNLCLEGKAGPAPHHPWWIDHDSCSFLPPAGRTRLAGGTFSFAHQRITRLVGENSLTSVINTTVVFDLARGFGRRSLRKPDRGRNRFRFQRTAGGHYHAEIPAERQATYSPVTFQPSNHLLLGTRTLASNNSGLGCPAPCGFFARGGCLRQACSLPFVRTLPPLTCPMPKQVGQDSNLLVIPWMTASV
jgi:hypothetical protein